MSKKWISVCWLLKGKEYLIKDSYDCQLPLTSECIITESKIFEWDNSQNNGYVIFTIKMRYIKEKTV